MPDMIAISDFRDSLMACGLNARRILLKIYVDLMMDSTILELISISVFSKMYRILMILR